MQRLTRREADVLRLLAAGLSNREIARRLSLSEGTTKLHLSRIYRKLTVDSRVQAVLKATGYLSAAPSSAADR